MGAMGVVNLLIWDIYILKGEEKWDGNTNRLPKKKKILILPFFRSPNEAYYRHIKSWVIIF